MRDLIIKLVWNCRDGGLAQLAANVCSLKKTLQNTADANACVTQEGRRTLTMTALLTNFSDLMRSLCLCRQFV